MTGAPKLKVFCTAIGFDDALVAVPSRKAALKAWGTTTDLFAAGRASEVNDPALRAEALARPGEVIRRPRGDRAAMLGPEPPRRTGPRRRPDLKIVPKRPPPDRSLLDEAERAVEAAERELAAELERLAADRAEIDRREEDVRRTADRRLAALRAARERAERDYEGALARSRDG